MKKRIAIIGSGIIGLAIGYKLSKIRNFIVHLYEKEDDIGHHQSGNNSGVLHCGLSYKPGSLKAKLAVDGVNQMIKFCENNEVEFDMCGKIVVGKNSDEDVILNKIALNGKTNGLKGLKKISPEEIKKIEPNVVGYSGLLVPGEGIVDFKGVIPREINALRF